MSVAFALLLLFCVCLTIVLTIATSDNRILSSQLAAAEQNLSETADQLVEVHAQLATTQLDLKDALSDLEYADERLDQWEDWAVSSPIHDKDTELDQDQAEED